MEPFVGLNDPNYVRDPETFLPERWLREDSNIDKINPYLIIPFSFGTRMCAGNVRLEKKKEPNIFFIIVIIKKYTQV